MRKSVKLLFIFFLSLFFTGQIHAAATTPTDPNLKIAIIGDVGVNATSEAVLNMIKNEGAAAVLHQGDFDYKNDPAQYDNLIQKVFGSSYPYFGSIGNHEELNWLTPNGGYKAMIQKRNGSYCTGDPGNMASCNYRGLFILEMGIGTLSPKDDPAQINYIKNQLASSNAIWKVCTWHKNQNTLQVGAKPDEVGWQAYEACREAGALILTAHEHTYHRTKTLTNMTTQTIDPTCNDPARECVAPGKTFVVVSGIGGHSVRRQIRCLPFTFPYGCNGVWSKIYTVEQNAIPGALFIIFNYQGNPYKAHGYFKNRFNQIIDEFDITYEGGTVTPNPQSPTPTTPSGQCSLKSEGDANCDNKIDFVDFEILRKEMTGVLSTKTSDFNSDGLITIADFELFRRGYYNRLGITPTGSPTGTVILPAPGNLTATCGSPGNLGVLNWSPVTGANSYWLILDDLSNPWSNFCAQNNPGDSCTSVTSNSHSFSSIPGHRYRWGLQAFNGSYGNFVLGPEFTCLN